MFQLFAEILSFSFYLVNSECDLYLAVDHSLVYRLATLKSSTIFQSNQSWAWFKTIFVNSYLDSCLLFLNLTSCSIWILSFDFPQLANLVFPFLISQWILIHTKVLIICICWLVNIKYIHFRLISLSALRLYVFIFFLSLASLTKPINC